MGGPPLFVGAHLFHSQHFRFSKIIYFANILDMFLDYLEYAGVCKNKCWFWGSGTRSKIQQPRKLGIVCLSPNRIEKLLVQNEAE